MQPVGAVVIFFISWWLCFFCVLPIGVEGQHEADPENKVTGSEAGAPLRPGLGKKALWALIGASVLTGIIHVWIVPFLSG